jgi:hypothetical protein
MQRVDPSLATSPNPTPPPARIVGFNSVRLSRIAGAAAHGINVPWRHPRRHGFLAAANESAGERHFLHTSERGPGEIGKAARSAT